MTTPRVCSSRPCTFILAPDAFKESLSQDEAIAALANGIRAVLPQARIIAAPVSDGGEGFLSAIATTRGLGLVNFPAVDALSRPLTATIGIERATRTAYLEAADTLGMGRVAPAERNIMHATSYGLGLSVRAALAQNVEHIVIGLGGTLTNDGGAGLAAALGARFFDAAGTELPPHPAGLREVACVDFSGLDPRLQNVKFTYACDVDNPLTGPEGASFTFGQQKGADPTQVTQLDELLTRLAQLINPQLATVAGTGAAGGLGYMLNAIATGERIAGIELFIRESGLRDLIAQADYVFTGEGKTDQQTTRGKAPAGIAKACREYRVPCICFAGAYEFDDDTPVDPAPFTAIVPILPRVMGLSEALATARANLSQAAASITRLLIV